MTLTQNPDFKSQPFPSGKQASVGSIVLFCLSLPIHLRYQAKYSFVAGVVPGPNQPSVVQIESVLRPLISELKVLWSMGVWVKTSQYPQGRLVKAALLAVTSDVPASKKIAGLGSQSASYLCTYCYIHKNQLENLNISHFCRRTKDQHMQEALDWKSTPTKSGKKKIFEKTGVRWSELNALPYWDPTKMVILDLMHNLAGILEYHARDLMNLEEEILQDKTKKTKQDVSEAKRISKYERIKITEELEEAELKDELIALAAEEADAMDIEEAMLVEDQMDIEEDLGSLSDQNKQFCKISGVDVDIPQVGSGEEVQDSDFSGCEEGFDSDSESASNSEGSDGNRDVPPNLIHDAKNAIKQLENLKLLRKLLAGVIVPSWIERPPSKFGSRGHGKIKFDVWFKT